MRENHYTILLQCLEFPTFSTYKRAYRFLFLKCHRQFLLYAYICVNPTAKLRNYYEILTVKRGDLAEFWLRSPHFYSLIYRLMMV